jgi:glycosyltransferase involved in cell wall biosynthesis
MYVPQHAPRPYVVTCHDLLALRGALGEQTDCPASMPGRYLQRLILAGLKRASAIVSVSEATQADVSRLVGGRQLRSTVIHSPLNYPFRILPAGEADRRIKHIADLAGNPYVLIVGSGLKRKNRDCAIRVLARIRDRWPGRFVFAGEPLSAELRSHAASLGVADRVLDVARPSDELLEALYNRALALLFPSRFEGFGWPLVEAQASGCPVVASNVPPHAEVTGGAAELCSLVEETTFDAALLKLSADPGSRDALITAGLDNTARFDRARFAKRLIQVYESVA